MEAIRDAQEAPPQVLLPRLLGEGYRNVLPSALEQLCKGLATATEEEGGLMQVTAHFWSEEWDCKDGTAYPAEWIETRLRPLCEALEVVREKLGGHPLTITSGYRTEYWNNAVGGQPASRHLFGDAADFIASHSHPDDVYQACLELQDSGVIQCGGLALYQQKIAFCHIDIRGRRVRWAGSPTQVPL